MKMSLGKKPNLTFKSFILLTPISFHLLITLDVQQVNAIQLPEKPLYEE